eukprot:gene10959-12120_t
MPTLMKLHKKEDNSMMKQIKSREFMKPIGHLKRRFVPTSAAISHMNEPTFFQNFKREEHSHYRKEFQPKPLSSTAQLRVTSPNRRNKPHPVQVYHLQRLRSGLVCDVRTKHQEQKESKEASVNSWTKTAYPPYKIEQIIKRSLPRCEKSKLPAIGIVPGAVFVVSSGENNKSIDEHWLPGRSMKLTAPLTVRGNYEYFPRKRKLILKREDAAGIKCPAEFGHRYHEAPLRRGLKPAQMTIRAGV